MSLPKLPFAPVANDSLQAFCDLLGARTGLQVREKDRPSVARTLLRQAESLGMSEAQYLQKLRVEKADGPEWTRLVPLLTNGESYFERDRGQIALLRDTILPEIIEGRRRAGEQTVRLWSAGCSTGEEAYSLAMIAAAVLPTGWKATILGTDINANSLQKARHGVYGEWSFRGVEAATRDRYFRVVAGGYEVVSELRERVTFGFCNLSADDWPDARRGIADMDLIVCRNVLIYFQREVVAGVVTRFARTLRDGGFLLTGHAELHDQNVALLRTRLFPASAAYQKGKGGGMAVSSGVAAPPTPAPRQPLPTGEGTRPRPRPVELPQGFSRAKPETGSRLSGSRLSGSRLPDERTVGTPTSVVVPAPVQGNASTADEWCAAARRAADGARYEEAVSCCRRAVEADSSHARAYCLWAHIAEELGRHGEAKELLKKVIYLAPSNAGAYVELAAIYEREGNAGRARQMRLSAMKLLQIPDTKDVSSPEAEERKELLLHIRELLGENDSSTPVGGWR